MTGRNHMTYRNENEAIRDLLFMLTIGEMSLNKTASKLKPRLPLKLMKYL